MRILMMAQHYAPEEISGAVLATELSEDLVHRGHRVTFITCAPNYPMGKVFPGYRNAFIIEMRNGVKIKRVWSYISPNKSFWWRIFNYGTFSLMTFLSGLRAEKPDVIFSYSPPLPLGVSAWLLSRIWRVPWVLRVEDLFPEAAVAAGVLKNSITIAFFEALERFLYRRATHISLISEGFRQNLLGKDIPATKLSVAPVWADPNIIRPLPKENAFRYEHGLQGKFVVLYSGNMGITSALEDLIATAALLQDDPEIVFLLVGEGVKKEALAQQAQGLGQVRFLPYQPRAIFPELMAAADVSVVTLNPASAAYSLPSKLVNIMSSERPMLALTLPESEMAHLVTAVGCGLIGSPNCPDEIAESILKLKNDPDARMVYGRKGRQYLLTHFSRHECVDLFEAVLQQVLAC